MNKQNKHKHIDTIHNNININKTQIHIQTHNIKQHKTSWGANGYNNNKHIGNNIKQHKNIHKNKDTFTNTICNNINIRNTNTYNTHKNMEHNIIQHKHKQTNTDTFKHTV